MSENTRSMSLGVSIHVRANTDINVSWGDTYVSVDLDGDEGKVDIFLNNPADAKRLGTAVAKALRILKAREKDAA